MQELKYNRIALMGPPGAGKGTQAAILTKEAGFNIISASGLLKTEIATGSQAGMEIKEIIDQGHLVPSRYILNALLNEINKPENADGYILDGFPRSLDQAEMFDEASQNPGCENARIDCVLWLDMPDDYIVDRIAGRFFCAQCGEVYHEKYKPTSVPNVCDVCGSTQFTKRVDDTKDVVESRLHVYRDVTAPIIPYYENKGLLVRVDGTGSIDAVSERIRKVIGY